MWELNEIPPVTIQQDSHSAPLICSFQQSLYAFGRSVCIKIVSRFTNFWNVAQEQQLRECLPQIFVFDCLQTSSKHGSLSISLKSRNDRIEQTSSSGNSGWGTHTPSWVRSTHLSKWHCLAETPDTSRTECQSEARLPTRKDQRYVRWYFWKIRGGASWRSDNLLDFAHKKGGLFNEDPNFPYKRRKFFKFSSIEPSDFQFFVQSQIFWTSRYFGNSSPLK